MLTCEWCGAEFERPSSMGPTPRFCSQSHRQRAYEVRRVERLVAEVKAEAEKGLDPTPPVY